MCACEMKVCPGCGRRVFADANMCYECLHEFEDESEKVSEESPEEELVLDDASWQLRLGTRDVQVTIDVPSEGLVVGRGSGCNVIVHDKAVSRRHVRIWPSNGCLLAQDLGARNPATVGKCPLESERELKRGDVVAVRSVSLTVV